MKHAQILAFFDAMIEATKVSSKLHCLSFVLDGRETKRVFSYYSSNGTYTVKESGLHAISYFLLSRFSSFMVVVGSFKML